MSENFGPMLPLWQGERFLGRHQLVDDESIGKPSRWRRPVAFRGKREIRGGFLEFLLDPASIFEADRLGDRVHRRANPRRESKSPKSPGWVSAGGKLGSAMHPRTRVHVEFFLELTDQRLRLVYTRRPKGNDRPESCVQPAWEVPLGAVSEIRARGDLPALYEFNFNDGSWMSLRMMKGGYARFIEQVRNPLGGAPSGYAPPSGHQQYDPMKPHPYA